MENTIFDIAFLGTGIMGSRMAANLLKAGHRLAVWNRTAGKADELVASGARRAEDPAAAAAGAQALVSMLGDPPAVEQAALGPGGFLESLPRGALWIDCSTISPAFARRMGAEAARRGLRYLEAPVTGSKKAAADAQLLFLVGGEAADLESARPLFERMGRGVIHLGPVGTAASLKIVNNMLAAQAVLAFSEALALGEALGMPRAALFDRLAELPVVAPYIKVKREKMLSGDYEADFPLHWMRKDLELATETAYELGAALPSANLAKELYGLAVRSGLGEADFSAIFKLLQGQQPEG